MPQLAEQFEKAKSNIEPPPDDVANASAAHQQVRGALETSPKLTKFGIDTVLIGSYSRHVAIRRINDVDVFSKLPFGGEIANPRALLDLVRDVLVRAFGAQHVELQDRSIKVGFPDFDLAVDAVPARPRGSHWEIPDRSTGWEATNPEHFGSLTTAMNEGHDGQYVPTVKLLRQARRAGLGEQRPGGFYIEIATYHAFLNGIHASSAAEYFVGGLAGVAEQLSQARVHGLPDPALPAQLISTRTTDADLERAVNLFLDRARRARAALDSADDCAAALEFRRILGKTSDDRWAFPMPSYCNEDGTRRPTATDRRRGSPTVARSGRFA